MVTEASSNVPVSRYGHTIIHCDDEVMYIFGGRSLEHGLLNDIWLYSFVTHTWTEIRPIANSDQPAGRLVQFVATLFLHRSLDNIGIKHCFSCINIRQAPWEVLKTEAEGRSFQHLPRDLANVNALKNYVRSLLLHKN